MYSNTPEGGAPRRKLSDILNGHGNGSAAETLKRQWESTEAAGDFAPLPAGSYLAHVQAVDLHQAKSGTPGVKITFRVCEGQHVGRHVFHDCWLTPAALPATKRDCLKLGLNTIEKLESASIEPGRIRCKVRVALRTDDSGESFNRVRGFDVLGIDDPPTVDDADFAPAPAPPEPSPAPASLLPPAAPLSAMEASQ